MANVQLAVAGDDNTQVILSVPGVQGPTGSSIPPSGTTNQILFKQSNTDYDTAWSFVTNAMVDSSAAIAGTKISPNFGSQNVVTTGTSTAASFIPTSSGVPTNGIYLSAANSISIATNSTQRLLIDSAGQIEAVSLGSAAAPTYSWTGDPNTGLYSPGADQVAISTNGTGRLFVDASGNVGIGTSSPGGPLGVAFTNATVYSATTAANNALAAINSSATTGSFASVSLSSRNTANAGCTVNLLGISTSTNNASDFAIQQRTTSGAYRENLRITHDGNVGIGTTPVVDLDVAPAASTATFRIHARSNTTPVASIELVRGTNTTFGADGSGDYRIKNDTGNLSFEYGDTGLTTERLRIDGSGRLLVGTSTSFDLNASVQSVGTSAYRFEGFRFGSDNGIMVLGSTNGTQASPSVLTSPNFGLGIIQFRSYDGAAYRDGAWISAVAESEWASADCPTRLVFSTTADSASSPTERFRITNDGVIAHDQPAPAAVNATATLTVANLKTGIITSTSALATDMTLPTGTDTEAGFSGVYTNMTFEWSVINTGPSLVRVLAGTAHTIVGSGSVATGTSGRFASRRTAANTFVTYRLS